MKKILLLAIVLVLHLQSSATHIVGGDITLRSLGANNFEVNLRFYRDCLTGTAAFDSTIALGVYDKVTNAELLQFNLSMISTQVLALGDSCFTPTGLCVEEGIYTDIINLPNNPNGYYVTWQRCCRNSIIQNIAAPGSAGMVFYVEVPDPALGNSSPVFGSYPKAFMCNAQPNSQDFSAIDPDGDSLAYELTAPLNGNASSGSPIPPPSSGPYTSISWQPPYSATDMMGGTPVLTINPITGMLVANPATLGVYVFAVVVKEYRNGVKIGEVRRDIQYQGITCNLNQPPVFSGPVISEYRLVAGDSLCIPVTASDINADWVGLSASSELFSTPVTGAYTSFANDSAIGTVQSELCFASNCSHIREQPYRVTFYARDYSCYGTNVITNIVDITVASPVDGKLDKIIPNVFTPNNDGRNDFFKVNVENINDCFDKFTIKIYNRWGQLVFDDNDFGYKWDGRDKHGKVMPDGVYFYMIDGNFRSESFDYQGYVQIIR